MADASPETLSAAVFARVVNGDRMTAGELIDVLEILMYRDGGIQNPTQIAALVGRFDPAGLTMDQFRQVLMGVDTYLRSLGYDDLETRLAVNVLETPPPVQRVEVPVVAAGPRLTDPIPNTTATYGDLADAFSPQQVEGAQLQGPQCMEVHRVAQRLRNFTRGMNILTGAVGADPRFTQYMINPARLVAGEDGYERVSDGDRTALINFIQQKMMSWLERSDIGAFRDPARRRLLVEGLLGELGTSHLPVNIQGYYAGTLMIAIVLFMDTALREYPTMQTTWTETVVRDGIEAYGESINTYDPDERPHISCPNGIMERFFIGLAGIIVGSAPAARAPMAPAPAAPAPAAQAPVYNPGAGMPPPDRVFQGRFQRSLNAKVSRNVTIRVPPGVAGVQGDQVTLVGEGWGGTFRFDRNGLTSLNFGDVRHPGDYTPTYGRAGGGRTRRRRTKSRSTRRAVSSK